MSRNPARLDEVVLELRTASPDQVDHAVEAAAEAFVGWRAQPAARRGDVLMRASMIMRERADELARAITREEGKIFRDARAEVGKAIDFLALYGSEGWRLADRGIPAPHPATTNFSRREPLGVVGLVTPWNVPLALACWKAAPALATGNTVVLKPAQLAPGLALSLARIFEEAELPRGVFNVVVGSGAKVGARLAAHPAVRAFSFTGGHGARERLYQAVSQRMARFGWSAPEAGGKNAIVVMPDADLDLAIRGIVHGAFTSSGQRCTATSRLIVHSDVHAEVVARVQDAAEKIVVGDGLDPAVDMGPVISEQMLEQMLEATRGAVSEGGTCITGGARLDDDLHARGAFVRPTIIEGVNPTSRLWRRELFGPVLAITQASSFDEAIELANDSPYRLASAIYSRDAERIMAFIDRSQARMVHVNAPTVAGEPHQPYAGIRGTTDPQMGRDAIDFFTEEKVVFWSHGAHAPLIDY